MCPEKELSAKKLLKEFPAKRSSFGALKSMIISTDSRGSAERKVGSGDADDADSSLVLLL